MTMNQMFEKAKAEGLWFHSSYQDLWFSPKELEGQQLAGKFRWGPENWTLENPNVHLEELKRDAKRAQNAVIEFQNRMEGCNALAAWSARDGL